ncbi:MAG: endonuclease NucS domain-containing protein [Cyanobacteria bacterium J06555_13]
MKCIVNVSSIASPSIHTNPRLRVFGKAAEFETELHLERFFLATVLPKLQLKPLASQYTCGQGICDILAIGSSNQLIIIELKNTKDTHVIEQITRYFDALVVEKPFESQVDYAQPIELYTVCPDYADSLAMTLKYHRLNFNVLAYRIKNEQDTHRFELWNWLSHEAIAHIEIPRAENTPDKSALPEPPKAFLKLLEKCTDREHSQASLIRQQIYEFSQSHNYKICERPDGQWIRFERNKQHPIAEIGWDNQRTELVIHLWLPFTTINGRLNLRRYPKYKRTSMMRIWVDNDEVKYLGYIHNSRRRWLIVTIQELKDERFPIPTKLNKWLKYTEGKYWLSEGGYWKGLAMPFKTYTGIMDLPDLKMSLQSVVQLALAHSLDRYTVTTQA